MQTKILAAATALGVVILVSTGIAVNAATLGSVPATEIGRAGIEFAFAELDTEEVVAFKDQRHLMAERGTPRRVPTSDGGTGVVRACF